MNRKRHFDQHVREYKTSPIGLKLRKFNSDKPHDGHVRVFNVKVRASLSRNTKWAKHEDETCLLWVGFNERSNNPHFVIGRIKFNAITHYQRMYAEVFLPAGGVWSKATCGNPLCLRHRLPLTRAEFVSEDNRQRREAGTFAKNCARKSRSRSPYTQQQVAKMKELHEQGLSSLKIAKLLDAKPSSVRHIVAGNRWADVRHAPSGISFIASQLLGAQA